MERRRLRRQQDGGVWGRGPLEEVGVGKLAATVVVRLEAVADQILVWAGGGRRDVVLVGQAQPGPLRLDGLAATLATLIEIKL
jgi:hypothetical protein